MDYPPASDTASLPKNGSILYTYGMKSGARDSSSASLQRLIRHDMRRLAVHAAVIAIACVIGVLGYWLWPRSDTFDPQLTQAIKHVNETRKHVEEIETEADFPDRRIRVSGIYLIDDETKRYAAYSTTTLVIPGMHDASFSLGNIAIPGEVYTRIMTDSPALASSIPHSPQWRHFLAAEIPQPFANIAIPGPIMHNLRIFDDGGVYLTSLKEGSPHARNGEELLVYEFMLSPKALSENAPGTLGALIDRIGPEGHVTAWIDPVSLHIRHMQLSAPLYRSTTTIHYPESLSIEPPSSLNQ